MATAPSFEELPPAATTRITDTERLGYDAVDLPAHYRTFEIEPILFCMVNKLDPLQSAINKYVCRFRLKNGAEDLYKAARCLEMLIAFEEGDADWWRLPSERSSKADFLRRGQPA